MLQQVLSQASLPGTNSEPGSKQEESPEARYSRIVQGLIEDAYRGKHVVHLVNVLTWALACVAHNFGPSATADVLGRLGSHLRWIADREAAQAEAETARRQGARPQ